MTRMNVSEPIAPWAERPVQERLDHLAYLCIRLIQTTNDQPLLLMDRLNDVSMVLWELGYRIAPSKPVTGLRAQIEQLDRGMVVGGVMHGDPEGWWLLRSAVLSLIPEDDA